MSFKTSAKGLRGLHETYYKVIGKETIKRTISAPLPAWTMALADDQYLANYRQYYSYKNVYYGAHLKKEYLYNRPHYEIEVSWDILEVEFTERGIAEMHRRYKSHKKNMERYAALLASVE